MVTVNVMIHPNLEGCGLEVSSPHGLAELLEPPDNAFLIHSKIALAVSRARKDRECGTATLGLNEANRHVIGEREEGAALHIGDETTRS